MASQWMQLSINKINDKEMVYGTKFRKILAKQNDIAQAGEKLDPILFNYTEAGFPRTEQIPEFRISSTGKTGKIFAVGSDAVQYLESNGHKISRFIANYLGRPVTEHRQRGEYFFYETNQLREYKIASMVFMNSAKMYKTHKKDLIQQKLTFALAQVIEQKIRDGILLHAQYLNLPVEPDFTLGDINIKKYIPIKINSRANRYKIAALDVTFRAGLNIGGIVHVGHLKNKGYGLIEKA